MPTYDYHCTTCDESFEMFQSFSDNSLKKCPGKSRGMSPEGCISPGRGRVEKMLSTPAIIFKGQGFYKTDSKAASSSNGSSDSQASDSKSSDKTSSESSEKKTSDSKSSEKKGSEKSAPSSSSKSAKKN